MVLHGVEFYLWVQAHKDKKMAEWVYIENGEIKEYYGELPKNWRHVSGLNLSANDLPFLKSLGWYPVFKNTIEYNSETHTLKNYSYEIRENDVVETTVIEEIPIEIQLKNIEDAKNNFFIRLREERNRLLSESDWTQLVDIQYIKGEQWTENWKNYRQALRELPSLFENIDNVNGIFVNWPKVPEQ